MADLKLDPIVGLEVRVPGFSGPYEIASVEAPNSTTIPERWEGNSLGAEGGRTVDLRRLSDDSLVRNVPWSHLRYLDESETWPVRHAIEWLKTNPDNRQFPSYIVDYEVEARNDHAGNPSIFVRFLVDPDYFYENGRPSEEKVAALNAFAYEVKQRLLDLGLDRWTYVQTGEARRALDVAS